METKNKDWEIRVKFRPHDGCNVLAKKYPGANEPDLPFVPRVGERLFVGRYCRDTASIYVDLCSEWNKCETCPFWTINKDGKREYRFLDFIIVSDVSYDVDAKRIFVSLTDKVTQNKQEK